MGPLKGHIFIVSKVRSKCAEQVERSCFFLMIIIIIIPPTLLPRYYRPMQGVHLRLSLAGNGADGNKSRGSSCADTIKIDRKHRVHPEKLPCSPVPDAKLQQRWFESVTLGSHCPLQVEELITLEGLRLGGCLVGKSPFVEVLDVTVPFFLLTLLF